MQKHDNYRQQTSTCICAAGISVILRGQMGGGQLARSNIYINVPMYFTSHQLCVHLVQVLVEATPGPYYAMMTGR